MPLHWRVDSREMLFMAVADGNVKFEDVEQVLDALLPDGVLGYRKLFDGTRGHTRMSSFELLTLGARMRTLHAGAGSLGPLALVLPEKKRPPLMRLLGIMAAARRPLRLFADATSAYRWLELPEGFAMPPRLSPLPVPKRDFQSSRSVKRNQFELDSPRAARRGRLASVRQ